MTTEGPRRILLVGGGGGFVGRALLKELLPDHRVRSLHRSASPNETGSGVEWVPGEVESFTDWRTLLDGVDGVVTLAWYRWASPRRFWALYGGLHRLLEAARDLGVSRFVQVSVPEAPPSMESGLPYLAQKRRFDRDVATSGLSYRVVRGSLLFGSRDKLLSVMLRLMHRYPRFPMFGDGNYHVNPLWVGDFARAIRLELDGVATGTFTVGGPRVYRFRELTDEMFFALRKPPHYLHLGPRLSLAVASAFQHLGSSLIYRYEVEWLMSDRLDIPSYVGLDRPLTPVDGFLRIEAERLRGAVAKNE